MIAEQLRRSRLTQVQEVYLRAIYQLAAERRRVTRPRREAGQRPRLTGAASELALISSRAGFDMVLDSVLGYRV